MVRSSMRARGMVPLFLISAGILACAPDATRAAELRVGGATTSITPDRPVPLSGQRNTRISNGVESPVTATALALESREGDRVVDQAILISCDLVAIRREVSEGVRRKLEGKLPGFDLRKLILSATHTHSAPEVREGVYEYSAEGVMPPTEYLEFLVDRLAEIAVKSWENRTPGLVGWGLGHAVVTQNRRAVYADGSAVMYGKTDIPTFRGIEGYEDHGIEVLCFWDRDRKLVATAINIACPSQEAEHSKGISADFWHEVRKQLRAEFGDDLLILGWTGAAGDQSPHLMIRKAAEERMRNLRGLNRLEEIARRVVAGWKEAYEGARQEMRADVPLVHEVRRIELPRLVPTAEQAEEARTSLDAILKDPKREAMRGWSKRWYGSVIDRYEALKSGPLPPYEMDLHALRLGDVAIATNDFELFTDYGIQIKGRSPAIQTFLIQLAGPGTYLPTERAIRGGSYSAIPPSNQVGPEGGQVLVERTLEAINTLWTKPGRGENPGQAKK